MVEEMVAPVVKQTMVKEEPVVRPAGAGLAVDITAVEEVVQPGLLVELEKSEYIAGR